MRPRILSGPRGRGPLSVSDAIGVDRAVRRLRRPAGRDVAEVLGRPGDEALVEAIEDRREVSGHRLEALEVDDEAGGVVDEVDLLDATRELIVALEVVD